MPTRFKGWAPTTEVGSSAFSFEFVDRDIRNQLEISAQLVDEAERLQKIQETVSDESARKNLQESIDSLLAQAKRLTDNAESTSGYASAVISSVSSSST